MYRKNSILLIVFLCTTQFSYSAAPSGVQSFIERLQQSLRKQYKQLKKIIFAKDWTAKYNKQEQFNATDAANQFKDALSDAIKKRPLMSTALNNNYKNFLFGASSSSYQYEGGLNENNASAVFYSKKNLPTAGNAIDFWNKYENDIKQMKNELGINSFRMSIAWERVEPEKEIYNKNAIQQYATMIQNLIDNNITPIIVLHHYTIPQWFADIGGFEKNENIEYFVNFAKKMYPALNKVKYWSTFNAIEGYAFKGYFKGDGAPGIEKSYLKTQEVMYNMLEAHVKVYQAIKGQNGLYNDYKNKLDIPEPQIGIQKNIVLLEPSKEYWLWVRTLTIPICYVGTTLQNMGFFNFFNKGIFNVPFLITKPKNDLAQKSIDWIGLNIYSNMHMLYTTPQQEPRESDLATENLNYRDYPEGIYRATQIINNIAKPHNIPIIITENGIATKDNNKRTRFFRRALYTIRKLIQEGYNIIGYTPWASHDNYEWPNTQQPDPYDRPYGFFAVDFNQQSPNYLTRTLKQGSLYYRDFIKAYFINIEGL